jgi:hypothetical protein
MQNITNRSGKYIHMPSYDIIGLRTPTEKIFWASVVGFVLIIILVKIF